MADNEFTGPAGTTPDRPPPQSTRVLWGVLTPRHLHYLLVGSRFVVFAVLFLFVLWLTPLSGTIDDEFLLTIDTSTTTTVEILDLPAAEPADPVETPTTVDDPVGTTTTVTVTAAADPAGGGTASPGPTSAGGSSVTIGSGGTPDPTPPPTTAGPPTAYLAAQFEAALFNSMTAGTATTLNDSNRSCLRNQLEAGFSPDQLQVLATSTGPAQLDVTTISTLVPMLDGCYPITTMLYDSLLAGQAPPEVASCIAPIMANSVTWQLLIQLEIDPQNEAANQQLGEIADTAAQQCY